MEALLSDVRFALRWLRKSPGFAFVAVASLAIGIGFNTALFTIVDAAVFRPLPVRDPGSLVDVYTSATTGDRFGTTSYPDFVDLSRQNDVFEEMIGYSPMFTPLNLAGRSRLTLGAVVSGNYFTALGVGAALGRTLLPSDDVRGAPPVAMVSYRYWIRETGGDAGIIGRTLMLRGNLYQIVGVAPRGFGGMTPILAPELWVPVSTGDADVEPIGFRDVVPSPGAASRLERRGDRWMFIRARLRPGSTDGQAQANLDTAMARLEAEYPATNRGRRISVKRTSSVHVHPAIDSALVPVAAVLMTLVGLVLLVACANVASLLLARASARQKEIGVRLAIGASRGRLLRQLVTEGVVLAAIGAGAGVALASWLLRLAESVSVPTPVPLVFDFALDGRALLFTSLISVGAGVLAGLAPGIQASRSNLIADLRGDAPRLASPGGWTIRDLLVAGQIAVTSLLLVTAALLTRSLVAAERASLGFDTDRLATVSMDPGMIRYTPERAKTFYTQALERVRAIPGVSSVALATRVPFSVNYNRQDVWVPGRHRPGEHGDTIDVTRVSSEYFTTIGVPIVEGRGFTSEDRPETPRVAIVNETMARRYWPGESALGKTFHLRGADGPAFTIVGVSADHKVSAVSEPPTPLIHFARDQQSGTYAAIVARTSGDANSLLRDMRRALFALEPNLVFVEQATMKGEVATTLFPVRAGAWIVAAVGCIAMLLAAVGLYGVIAYTVARRTKEMGIRLALGAGSASVVGLVMRRGLLVAGIGLASGYLLMAATVSLFAVFAAGAVGATLYGVTVGDPVSWTAVAVLILAVSAAANVVPARRASRVAPSEALRAE